MIPYLSAIKDGAIVLAIVLLGWWIYHTGANAVKVDDIKAVQTQIESNAKQVAQWAQESRNAATQHQTDMAQVSAAIAANHTPVILRGPTDSCPASGPASPAASQPPSPGGADLGFRADTDLRAQINEFELKYESALADCRQALASWPR